MQNQLETMSSGSGRSEGEAEAAADERRCPIEVVGPFNTRENAP
jgi:hypothetical protein